MLRLAGSAGGDHDLYRHQLWLFQNLFLPSVKLLRKVRVGSRLCRRYQAPQTPFQRVAACPNSVLHPQRVAELQCLRDTLDPFALSHTIQIKLERIFQLSAEAVGNPSLNPQPSPLSTTAFIAKSRH
jgi:hypothetical protein